MRAPAPRYRTLVALSVLGLVGCARACDSPATDTAIDAGAPTRPLPALVQDPLGDAATPTASEAKKARLAALGLRRGAFDDAALLRVARDDDDPSGPKTDAGAASAESVGVATVAFFHTSFAKAHPGFSLTEPTRLSSAELAILANDLAEASMAVLAATELASARARWGKGSTLLAEIDDEAEWSATRPVLAEAARALSAKAKAHADRKESLWVLAR